MNQRVNRNYNKYNIYNSVNRGGRKKVSFLDEIESSNSAITSSNSNSYVAATNKKGKHEPTPASKFKKK
jgi:hypothetical protein